MPENHHYVVTAEDIKKSTKTIHRGTAGGLQQVTPWLIRRAVESDTNDETATLLAHLATRLGRGDFNPITGEQVAAGRLIPLFKNAAKKATRPVVVGASLRRLLTKAYVAKSKEK